MASGSPSSARGPRARGGRGRHRRRVASLLVGALVAAALLAGSAPARALPGVAIDVGVGTTVPVLVGPSVRLELPARILLSFELGWLPSGYVDMINGIGKGFDGYDDSTALMVSSCTDNSLIVRFGAGWRPFSSLGLEFTVGYTLAALGGDLASADAIEAATGQRPAGSADVPLSSTLHGFHVNVSYRWLLWRSLVLRASVGYLQIVGSSTTTDLTSSRGSGRLIEAINAALDAYMHDIYTTYVKAPTFGVDLYWRF